MADLWLGDDEVDWPLDHAIGRKADQLEEDMHCPICTDFYDNPHLLITCGHSFCSICIRKHFDAKLNPTSSGICPACRKKGQSADLVKNVALAAIIDRYKVVRSDIFELLQSSLKKAEETNDSSVNTSTVNRKSGMNQANGTNTRVVAGEPIVSRMPQFNSHGANLQKIKNHIEYVTKKSKVKLRLDGDKETLDKRLRELIHQINAQVDHHSPLTLDEVIAKVNREEKMFEEEQMRSKLASKKSPANNFDELVRKAKASTKRKLDNDKEEIFENTATNTAAEIPEVHAAVPHPSQSDKEESLIFPPSQTPIILNSHQNGLPGTQATLLDPPMSCATALHASPTPTSSAAIGGDRPSSSIEIIELDGESSQPQKLKATTISLKKGQWNCPSCTFLNDKLHNRCAICETENPLCPQATRRSSRSGAPALKQQKLSTLG